MNPLARRVAELELGLAKAHRRAERAEALAEVQKEVAELLGTQLDENGERR